MKFKVKGTKTTLSPRDKSVAESYASRPDIYEPADAEAKAVAAKITGDDDKETGGGDDDGGGG